MAAPTYQILKVYLETLTGFSHMPSLDRLNTAFLTQGYILGAASRSKESKWNAHPKAQEREELPIARVQFMDQTKSQVLLITSPNIYVVLTCDM